MWILTCLLFLPFVASFCPPGSEQGRPPSKENWCYITVLTNNSFANASAHCETLGGRLATVTSDQDNEQIQAKIFLDIYKSETASQTYYYIGAQREWLWSQKGNRLPVAYFHFPDHESISAQCVKVNLLSGEWKSSNCLDELPSMCEVPASTSSTRSIPIASTTIVTPTCQTPQPTLPPTSACEPGWFYHASGCYTIVNKISSWFKAINECKNRSAVLASVHSNAQEEFLGKLLVHFSVTEAYLGAARHASGEWSWAPDGKPDGTPWNYSNFLHPPHNPPRRDMFYCLSIVKSYSSSFWLDIDCWNRNRSGSTNAICYKPSDRRLEANSNKTEQDV
ncbi:hypothetical protein L596_016827 [Steinernema carpocapsae]|uniref:C-type lectin domain-containing protein n=1 Tax=Steinernema carpocapsae TaxID=34508 RepID=A0A4U5NKN6_STECR|nr:hypothetical protein L596_016827 [Steinernema carpocapsae]